MTGRLATHHSSTTVLISKILIHASVYQYNKYQSHKSTGRSKTKTTSNGGESMGSGALQTTIGLSTSRDICVSHQTRRLRCQVHTQLSSVSSLFLPHKRHLQVHAHIRTQLRSDVALAQSSAIYLYQLVAFRREAERDLAHGQWCDWGRRGGAVVPGRSKQGAPNSPAKKSL